MNAKGEFLLIGVSACAADNESMARRLTETASRVNGEGVAYTYGKFPVPGTSRQNLDPASPDMLRLREILVATKDGSYHYDGCVLVALNRTLSSVRGKSLAVLGRDDDSMIVLPPYVTEKAVRLVLALWLSGAALSLSASTWSAALSSAGRALDI